MSAGLGLARGLSVRTLDRAPLRSVAAIYALPLLAIGFMMNMVGFYFLKYATDVLLLAPATVGLIFGASRIWDAVTDPVAGYWSDRTRSRWGRRRPWMLASALPLGLCFFALWSPPPGLEGAWLVVWVGCAIFGLSMATTAFGMPHAALGAELTTDYHERTRIFTWSKVFEAGGGLVGLGVLALVISGGLDQREPIAWLSAGAGALCIVLIATSVARLRERPENQGRGALHAWGAIRDVWRNRHARPLLMAGLLGTLGGACAKVVVPYSCEYVLGDLELMPVVLIAYAAPLVLAQPIWLPLSRRFDKKAVWLMAAAVQAVGLGALFFGDVLAFPLLLGCVACAGAADGGTSVLGVSLKADVIDADELATNERKEGTYYAVWGLAMKTSFGLAAMFVGWALGASGFEAGGPQSASAVLAIRSLQGLAPLLFLGVAALCMLRFGLNAAEHTRIRLALEARARTPGGSLTAPASAARRPGWPAAPGA